MKTYQKRFLHLVISYLLLNILLTGCATTLEHTPRILRSESPEVAGKKGNGGVNFNLGSGESRVYGSLENGFWGSNLDSSEARIRRSLTLGTNGSLGVASFMDVYGRWSIDTPPSIGAKFQLFGLGKKQNGWKVSASTEIGITGNDTVDGAKDISKELSINMYDVSVNIGYRYSPHFIAYINNFYSVYDIDGSLSRSSNILYATKGESKGFGTLIGVRHDFVKKNRLHLLRLFSYMTYEFGFVRLNWLDTRDSVNNIIRNNSGMKQELFAFGISLGHSWL